MTLDNVRENLIAIKDTLEDLIPDCLVLTAQSGKEGLKVAFRTLRQLIVPYDKILGG